MKTTIQVLLIIAIAVLSYLCIDSINQPVRFTRYQKEREAKVVERLKDIRSAQVAYRSIHGKYTGSLDTLVNFVKTDSLPMVMMEGSLTDSMLEAGITEIIALKQGIIKRDTTKISVMDSLFKKSSNWTADSLQYVPFTDKVKFEMGAGEIVTVSGVTVSVFEAKVHNNVYLKGLDEQEIININDKERKLEKYPGLKVGSLEEANNNAGNWE